MPRPKIDPSWIEKIRGILANNSPRSAAEIWRGLKRDRKLKNEDTTTPVPSVRAIGRIMKEFKNAPEEERLPYQVFAWPGSMENGALPWEASRAVLDLLRYRTEIELVPPTIREAQWFWRVTLAIPDAPIEKRQKIAMRIAIHEIAFNPSPQTFTAIQWEMAYQPWRLAKDQQAYDRLPSNLRKHPVMELSASDAEMFLNQRRFDLGD